MTKNKTKTAILIENILHTYNMTGNYWYTVRSQGEPLTLHSKKPIDSDLVFAVPMGPDDSYWEVVE